MSFTDHKITQFVHRIVDLPDQPNLPADELKARFDSSPEELRQAVNGICDDAAVLDTKVSGIISGSFEGAVDKSILSAELAAELDAKATQAALTEQAAALEDAVADEIAARESADTALDTRLDELSTSLGECTRIETGSYTGNGESWRAIMLPCTPKALFIAPNGGQFMRMVLQGHVASHGNGNICSLYDNGLALLDTTLNANNAIHYWLALV